MNDSATNPLNAVNSIGDSALILAARKGNLNELRCLVDQVVALPAFTACARHLGHFLAGHTNKYGKSILHEATQQLNVNIVYYCLDELRMPVDSLKQGDWTPLMLLAASKSFAARYYENGFLSTLQNEIPKSDVYRRNKDGWTALHVACRAGHVALVRWLITLDMPLCRSVSKNGRTPLHTCAMYDALECAKVIMKSDRDLVKQMDSCGTTPFMDVCRQGNVHMMRLMLANDPPPDVRHRDATGREALHVAAEAGKIKVIEILVDEFHVPYDSVDENCGMNVVHFAARQNHVDLLKEFRRRYPEAIESLVTATSKHGRTPLHVAVIAKNVGFANMLLQEFGVDVDVIDDAGCRPSDYAKTSEMKQLFLAPYCS